METLTTSFEIEITPAILYLIKYNLKRLPALHPKKFSSDDELREIINKYYYCDICKKLIRGWAVQEELNNDKINRILILDCGHSYSWDDYVYWIDLELHEIGKLWLKVEVHDRNKNKIRQLYQRSHSFINPFIYALRATYNDSNDSVNDVTNTARTFYVGGTSGPWIAANAASGDSSYGVVIGTGTTANSTTTVALASLIANGTGAGQMQYGASTVGSTSISGSTIYLPLSRTMTNNSGGTITVGEAGIYVRQGSPGYTFCFVRDVLATAQPVANGNSITINYQLQITVS
jgi:hypothetical protein